MHTKKIDPPDEVKEPPAPEGARGLEGEQGWEPRAHRCVFAGVLQGADAAVRAVRAARAGGARALRDAEGWHRPQCHHLWLLQQGVFERGWGGQKCILIQANRRGKNNRAIQV